MLTITNKALVDEIFAAKLPRSRDEVIREIYPEATQDRNGRYHAPYDGYECPLTGITFRAGEYLPMDEPDSDDTFPVAGRAVNYPAGRVLATGELVKWEGTRGQNRAAWGEILRQSREYDATVSKHIGEVGGKVQLDLVLEFVKAFDGFYGLTFIHVLKDSAGNVVVYKGSKCLSKSRGAVLKVQAKVKAHGERDGVAQTIIERPKLVA
jgi:hypothetical protein